MALRHAAQQRGCAMSSFERRMRRAQRREAAKKMLAAARTEGCVCDVEIVFDAPDHPLAGHGSSAVHVVSLRHDDWCPLLRVMEEHEPGLARAQLLLYRRGGEAT